MKKNILRRIVYLFLMVTLMFTSLVAEASNHVVILNNNFIGECLPLHTYAPKKVNCYTKPNGSQKGWIAANVDLIKVTKVQDGSWAYGSYPTNSGHVSRWFKLSDIVPPVSFSQHYTRLKYNNKVYRTANSSSTIGTVYKTDTVLVVSKQGNRCQIIYKLDNGSGYKMGWIPTSCMSVVPL